MAVTSSSRGALRDTFSQASRSRCAERSSSSRISCRTASRALGYGQVLGALDGRWTLEQARDLTVTATRRFARRQRAWFRRDPRVTWLDAVALDPAEQLAAALACAT